MEQCRLPDILDINSNDGATTWKRRNKTYTIYETAKELELKSQSVRIAIFHYSIRGSRSLRFI